MILVGKYSILPWKEMAGTRDIISHEYDRINFKILVNTINNYIPDQIKQLEEILGKEFL